MSNQIALITGASRGLGLTLAHALADSGWQLIINARGADALTSAEQELAAKTTVVAIAGDVTSEDHRNQLTAAVESLGGVDVVVNNASILGTSPLPTLLNFPLDTLAHVYQVNVIAPLAILQAVKDHTKDGFRVLNVSSDAGAEAYPTWGGYGSSKAALDHLSAILAEEQPDWKVYQVDPGDMRTQMHQDAFPNEDISDRPLPEVSVPGFLRLIEGDLPSGRYIAQSMLNEKSEATIQELRVVLTTQQFQEAMQFYRDTLNLEVAETWAEGDGQGILFNIERATLEVNDAVYAQYLDELEVGKNLDTQLRLAFKVDNTADSGDRAVSNGAHTISKVVKTPWGNLNQRLTTHDELQVTFFQDVE